MKNQFKTLLLAAVAFAFTNCQHEQEPEPLAPQATVTNEPVSLTEAKSLFEATQAKRHKGHATARAVSSMLDLQPHWEYFRQTQTPSREAYSKLPITIGSGELDAQMLFINRMGHAEHYLFITEVDSLTSNNRIVSANFYLLDPTGIFISAYRMTDGHIMHQLVPKERGIYQLVVEEVEHSVFHRKKKKKGSNLFQKVSKGDNENSETEGVSSEDNTPRDEKNTGDFDDEGSGGTGWFIQLEGVEVSAQINHSSDSYRGGTTNIYLPSSYDFYTPEPNHFSNSDVGIALTPNATSFDYISPDNPITDSNCFFNGINLTQGAEVTIYVDEPKPNSGKIREGTEVGHTFVGILQNGKHYIYGFYPDVPGYKTVLGSSVISILGNDGGHKYSVSIATNVSAEQLEEIVALSKSITERDYNLSKFNCTDFAGEVATIAGISLPNSYAHWVIGKGSNPGRLGKALRENEKANTNGGNAPASKGGCL